MNDQLDIIELGVAGVDLLGNIHRMSFEKMPEQVWTINEFKELFSVAGTTSYVINKAGEPIGFILIRKVIEEAEIITFCILPKYCKNGYATLLLEWVIRELQRQSVKRFFLEVRENNSAAIRLYEKCSFEIIARRKDYYNNHCEKQIDALVMECRLIV